MLLPLLAAALSIPQAPLDLSSLPPGEPSPLSPAAKDWLVQGAPRAATIYRDEAGKAIVLDNGLLRRTIRITGTAATVGLDDLMTGRSLLRAVGPEAQVTLDGVPHDIGGLSGQPNLAYLDPDWLEAMEPPPGSWRLSGFATGLPEERLAWAQVRRHAPGVAWPPSGVALRLDFAAPASAPALADVTVSVHYELYDGVPVLAKWLTVLNAGAEPVRVDDFSIERLSIVERDSIVESRPGEALEPPDLRVETEYSMGGLSYKNSRRHGFRWLEDPGYTSQVNYLKRTPCLLDVGPENEVLRDVAPGGSFSSFRAFIGAYDSEDVTRRALTDGRIYRTIAPWVTENPLMMHVRHADPDSVRLAIDQCAEVGFEMVILTFGSGFNVEDTSEANLDRMRDYVTYGRERGVEVGTYSLLSSRRVSPPGDNCINPLTGEPGGEGMIHGGTPSLASGWGQGYLRTLRNFFATTGAMLLEHDGPYPGNLDAAARPPLQRGASDSRYVNWMLSRDLYAELRARGVYINAPDWYFLVGTNKCGMGYREVNWSLPRAQQVIHTRQNIYDGTKYKLPSMGWMFVPLTQYHGGGAAATVEPLDEHLDHYTAMLAGNLGAGVQACYRGPRLYDTPRVRDAVKAHVDWFKAHRDILESPIVHAASRRADGRDLDWVLHAKPELIDSGLMVLHNPTAASITRTVIADLYYAGLNGRAVVEGGSSLDLPASSFLGEVELDRRGRAAIEVEVPAGGMAWLSFRRP